MKGARRNKGFLIPALLVVLVTGFVWLSTRSVQADSVSSFVDVEMWYCSSMADERCQPSVSNVQVKIVPRQPDRAELYGYEVTESARVKLQHLELRLGDRGATIFAEGEAVRLFADDDGDGLWGPDDRPVAEANLRGKRMVFEDLNVVLEGPSSLEQPLVTDFFIVRQGGGFEDVPIIKGGEVAFVPFFEDVNASAIDLDSGNRALSSRGALADRSVFRYMDLIGLSRQEVIDRYPFLVAGQNPNELVLGPGVVNIDSDVIIAEKLSVVVAPGTTIRLGADVSLVSYSPMTMIGTAANPIVIEKSDVGPFGTFAVVGSMLQTEPTTLAHVNVSGGSEARINGAFLSGMMSLYRVGDVRIENSVFTNAEADDALNVKYSRVEIASSRFSDNSADSIDGDFVTGTITDSIFERSGNDGVDLSGSDVLIANNVMIDIGDKCASIGEATTADVRDNRLERCGSGVVVKDGSRATIAHNVLVDTVAVHFDAYIKKSFFSEPSVTLGENVLVGGATPFAGLLQNEPIGDLIIYASADLMADDFVWATSLQPFAP